MCIRDRNFAVERLAACLGRAQALSESDPQAAARTARETLDESSSVGLRLLAAEAALVIVATAQTPENVSCLEHVLSAAADLDSPLLRFRAHATALGAGVGDAARQRSAALIALAQLEPGLGPYRDGFMRRADVRSVQRPT